MASEDASNNVGSIANFVRISVSNDRLFAYADFRDPPLKNEDIKFTGKDLLELLGKSNLRQGLISEEEANQLILSWMTSMNHVKVAEGISPTSSIDDALEFLFEKEVLAAPMQKTDGSVDYRELGILKMINANERLAMIKRGASGKPGIDVYGNEIPIKPPKQLRLPKGKFTYESSDGIFLLAEISGQIIYVSDQKISVSPVFHVKEDVDFSTGNINFNGSVVVHGNVNAGFRVVAEGNIEVMGIVEAADLKAGGDIIIRGGIQGSTTTRITAIGTIRALYLQNSVVYAGGDVIVSDSIMNSVVQADEVRVIGKRGLLVGGLAKVKKGLFARVLGSNMGAKTRIEMTYFKQLEESIHQLEVEQAQKKQALAKIEEILSKLEQLESMRKILTPEQMENKLRLIETQSVEKERLQAINLDYQEKLAEWESTITPVVEIGTIAYPGVIIFTGNDTLELDEILRSGRIVQDANGLHKS